jgi:putative transcriptional regulator
MTATFHPDEELLLAYAAGSLDEATSLLIATHATFCPRCRGAIADAEAVGGAVLEELPPDELGDAVLAGLLTRLDGAQPAAPAPAAAGLPAPLAPYLPRRDGGVAWRWLAPGVKHSLLLEGRHGRARLLKIAPDKPMPHHRHRGLEYTLVLEGAYTDEKGRYEVGDFTVADGNVAHQPIALGEGCVCLVLSGAPMQLTGRFAHWLNPLLPF